MELEIGFREFVKVESTSAGQSIDLIVGDYDGMGRVTLSFDQAREVCWALIKLIPPKEFVEKRKEVS